MYTCPICGTPAFNPSNRIGTGYDFSGRCTGYALLGKANYPSTFRIYQPDAWYPSKLHRGLYCGFPLCRPDGQPWISLDSQTFVNMTRGCFDPRDLVRATLRLNFVSEQDFNWNNFNTTPREDDVDVNVRGSRALRKERARARRKK